MDKGEQRQFCTSKFVSSCLEVLLHTWKKRLYKPFVSPVGALWSPRVMSLESLLFALCTMMAVTAHAAQFSLNNPVSSNNIRDFSLFNDCRWLGGSTREGLRCFYLFIYFKLYLFLYIFYPFVPVWKAQLILLLYVIFMCTASLLCCLYRTRTDFTVHLGASCELWNLPA